MLTTLTLLPRFSLESLPIILLIILILVLFAVLLWYALSKVPEPIGSWARWIAIIIGGILLLWFLISLIPGSGASADAWTTVPAITIIIPRDTAERLYRRAATEQDLQVLHDAIGLTHGIEDQSANPCHPKPSAVIEGRFSNNCDKAVNQ